MLILRRIALGLIAATLGLSLLAAAKRMREWPEILRREPNSFDRFVGEARAKIPPDARVRAGDGPTDPMALLLSTRLHPRTFVWKGPADWIIEYREVRGGEYEFTLRRASP